MAKPQRPSLKSDVSATRNTKYLFTFILTLFCVGMLNRFVWGRLIVLCPTMLAAAFFLSLATVEVRDGVLRYKRFFKWKTIDEKTILGCGELMAGTIGCLRLSYPVLPWKRLYFVLDARPQLSPFTLGDSLLLEYLKHPGHHIKEDPSPTAPTPRSLSNRALLLVSLAATTFSFLIRFLFPPLPPYAVRVLSPNASLPALIFANFERLYFRFITSFPAALALCALFIALTAYMRRRPDAWIYALISGFAIGGILFHLL